MKRNKLIYILPLLALLTGACKEKEEPEKDTTPAVLKSFVLRAADNSSYLKEDVSADAIQDLMILRIPGGGVGRTLTATLTAGENDVIQVNDAELTNGKASFDATYPVDIVVTNSKSGLVSTYEVKVGKILETVVRHLGTYKEAGATMNNSMALAVNPKDKTPYIAYTRQAVGDAKVSAAVVKYDGSAFVPVGTPGFVPDLANTTTVCSMHINADGVPYVLYRGGNAGTSRLSLMKFDGTWNFVGAGDFTGINITSSYGNDFYFSGNGIGVPVTVNVRTEADYRSARRFFFNGSSWTSESFIPDSPHYGESTDKYGATPAASHGMYYNSVFTTVGSTVYGISSFNYWGWFVYKIEGNTWQVVVPNWLPSGEQYDLPTNLVAESDAQGNVYFLVSLGQTLGLQVLKLDGSNLTPYGDMIPATSGSSGSIKEKMAIGVNPVSGQIVGVKDDADGKPVFSFINDDLRWEDWTAVADQEAKTTYYIEYAADGTGYLAYYVADVGIEFFQIGLEEDILPE